MSRARHILNKTQSFYLRLINRLNTSLAKCLGLWHRANLKYWERHFLFACLFVLDPGNKNKKNASTIAEHKLKNRHVSYHTRNGIVCKNRLESNQTDFYYSLNQIITNFEERRESPSYHTVISKYPGFYKNHKADKQESMAHVTEQNKLTETVPEEVWTLDLQKRF